MSFRSTIYLRRTGDINGMQPLFDCAFTSCQRSPSIQLVPSSFHPFLILHHLLSSPLSYFLLPFTSFFPPLLLPVMNTSFPPTSTSPLPHLLLPPPPPSLAQPPSLLTLLSSLSSCRSSSASPLHVNPPSHLTSPPFSSYFLKIQCSCQFPSSSSLSPPP